MTAFLKRNGHSVNGKRIQRLMQQKGIEAIYPKLNLSKARADHKIYPYLLRVLNIERQNQVCAADIRLSQCWLYLVAIMNWVSRYVPLKS